MMKLVVLPLLASGTLAFTTPSAKQSTALRSSAVPIESGTEIDEEAKVYPTVNGWTADPAKFCAGLPGAIAPLGDFDPLGFTKDLPLQEVKRYREAEVTHGRVAMLATIGYLVAEKFHPLFGGVIDGPANSHLGQVQDQAPFFFAFLAASIGAAEIFRSFAGWEFPLDAIRKNQELAEEEGYSQTWLSKLNDDYYPGDIGFDPMGLKPSSAAEFATMQTKELQNGRLAMIAAMGMIVQEQVTGSTLF